MDLHLVQRCIILGQCRPMSRVSYFGLLLILKTLANIGSMSAQRLRRWVNFDLTFGRCLEIVGY